MVAAPSAIPRCGVMGLKPSRGRVTLGPDVGEAWSGCVTELVITRSVRDTAAVLDAVAGYFTGDPVTAVPPDRPYVSEIGRDPGRLRVGMFVGNPETPGAPEARTWSKAARTPARRARARRARGLSTGARQQRAGVVAGVSVAVSVARSSR